MTKFTSMIPVLPALDVAKTHAFYERKLGFKELHIEKEFGIITRDGFEIHFWLCHDRKICEASGCRILVRDIDDLYISCKQNGIVHPNAPLEEKPWGCREFGIIDLDRNLITFAEYKPRHT